MNLAVSNIAWNPIESDKVYAFLKENNITGLEIAPTVLFPVDPYSHTTDMRIIGDVLYSKYGLKTISLQSIWYGIKENIFFSRESRNFLEQYTKRAIDFAAGIGATNLVFGCPRNRTIRDQEDIKIAQEFFWHLGEYAAKRHTILALEANPVIYHTNFINETKQAFDMVRTVDSKGFKVNLDVGTVIYNEESLDIVKEGLKYINHIHISEPNLQPIKKRIIHKKLYEILRGNYKGYISLEMAKSNQQILFDAITYIKDVFR